MYEAIFQDYDSLSKFNDALMMFPFDFPPGRLIIICLSFEFLHRLEVILNGCPSSSFSYLWQIRMRLYAVHLFLICGRKIGGSLFCGKIICGSPRLKEEKSEGEGKNVGGRRKVWGGRSIVREEHFEGGTFGGRSIVREEHFEGGEF